MSNVVNLRDCFYKTIWLFTFLCNSFVFSDNSSQVGVFGVPDATAVTYSPDGKHVAVGSSSGGLIHIFSKDESTGELSPVQGSPVLAFSDKNIINLEYSVDGSYIAALNTLSSDGTDAGLVFKVDKLTGQIKRHSSFNTGNYPSAITYSPDNKFAVVSNFLNSKSMLGSGSFTVYNLDKNSGEFTKNWTYTLNGQPRDISFSPDSKFVAVTSYGTDELYLYSVDNFDGKFTQVDLPTSTAKGPISLSYSSDGKHLAVANRDSNLVSIYSVSDCAKLNLVDSYPAGFAPSSVRYSSSGLYLAASSKASDDTCIWKVDSAKGALLVNDESPKIISVDSSVSSSIKFNSAIKFSPKSDNLIVPTNKSISVIKTSDLYANLDLEAKSSDKSSEKASIKRFENNGDRQIFRNPTSIAITSPTASSTVCTQTPTISGTSSGGSDGDQIIVKDSGGTTILTTTIDAGGDWSGTSSTLTTGSQTITAEDAAGAVFSPSITFTVATPPTVSVSPASATICNGGSTTLTASGADTYSWTPADGLSATTGATVTANPTTTKTYTVTGTVTATGCTGTKTVTVTVTSNPTVAITTNPSPATIFTGERITLTASGATTYSWSTGQTTASIRVKPKTNTTYTVTGTTSGCTATASQLVTVRSRPIVNPFPGGVQFPGNPPAVMSQPSSQAVFVGDSATFKVTAAPGTTFQWQKNGVNIPGATSASFNIASVKSSDAGSYTVTITDGVGLAKSKAAILKVT